MDVAIQSVAGTSEFKGKTYYFCSTGCKELFEKEPEAFISENDEDKANSQS